jgi:hypothetical protein
MGTAGSGKGRLIFLYPDGIGIRKNAGSPIKR